MEPRLVIFWLVHLATLALFVVGLLAIVSVWLKARMPGLPDNASRWRKLWAGILFVLRFVFSRRIWIFLKSLFVDGLAIRRLYKTDVRRWLIHASILGSWLILGIVSTITGVVVEFLPRLGMTPEEAASIPIIGQLFHADVWWVALLNEVLGLVVMAGMLLVLWRRYVKKDAQLRTTRVDTLILVLLALIAFSGFPTETFRLLADYTSAPGVFAPAPEMIPPEKLPEVLYPVWGPQWAFVGYLSALVLGGLAVGEVVWEVLHNVFFWSHFLIVLGLLYLLPFSRFFHIVMGPTIVAYNTTMEQEALRAHSSKRPALTEPAAARGGRS
jgi:nitrate reductase gamma subunit